MLCQTYSLEKNVSIYNCVYHDQIARSVQSDLDLKCPRKGQCVALSTENVNFEVILP